MTSKKHKHRSFSNLLSATYKNIKKHLLHTWDTRVRLHPFRFIFIGLVCIVFFVGIILAINSGNMLVGEERRKDAEASFGDFNLQVVGGNDAEESQWPFMVGVVLFDNGSDHPQDYRLCGVLLFILSGL